MEMRPKKSVRARLWQVFYDGTGNFELQLLGSGWSWWALGRKIL